MAKPAYVSSQNQDVRLYRPHIGSCNIDEPIRTPILFLSICRWLGLAKLDAFCSLSGGCCAPTSARNDSEREMVSVCAIITVLKDEYCRHFHVLFYAQSALLFSTATSFIQRDVQTLVVNNFVKRGSPPLLSRNVSHWRPVGCRSSCGAPSRS